MEAKTIEIRDAATFIPALAVNLSPGNLDDRYLLARAGYGLKAADQGNYVMLIHLARGWQKTTYDPTHWVNRTFQVAHRHIIDHWDEIESGDVVDVQYVLGETAEPKVSERIFAGGGE